MRSKLVSRKEFNVLSDASALWRLSYVNFTDDQVIIKDPIASESEREREREREVSHEREWIRGS